MRYVTQVCPDTNVAMWYVAMHFILCHYLLFLNIEIVQTLKHIKLSSTTVLLKTLGTVMTVTAFDMVSDSCLK